MDLAVEFLLRLLEHHPMAFVDWDDLHGKYAALLCACQAAGFLALRPQALPAPGCPWCGEGVPGRVGRRLLCDACFADVDPRRLCGWPLDLDAFLAWLAAGLGLAGSPSRIEQRLWHLGTFEAAGGKRPCFYRVAGGLSAAGRHTLLADGAVVLHGLTPPEADPAHGRFVSLREVLRSEPSLSVAGLGPALGGRRVRFDPATGSLWLDGVCLGAAPYRCREYHLLAVLAERQGAFTPYAELKREVLRRSGGRDGRDAASFCHRLKSRLKSAHVPRIDEVLVSGRGAGGYLLGVAGDAYVK